MSALPWEGTSRQVATVRKGSSSAAAPAATISSRRRRGRSLPNYCGEDAFALAAPVAGGRGGWREGVRVLGPRPAERRVGAALPVASPAHGSTGSGTASH
jgi:hypothetical protein